MVLKPLSVGRRVMVLIFVVITMAESAAFGGRINIRQRKSPFGPPLRSSGQSLRLAIPRSRV
jgi:hypothetical protein